MTEPVPRTVAQHIAWCAEKFQHTAVFLGHGTDNYWDEAVVLVLGCCGLSAGDSKNSADQVLTAEQTALLRQLVTARIEKRLPSAYLVGQAWFAGMCFIVDNRVMIPRSPIAELIESGYRPWLQEGSPRVLDLGTGSACIALATAYHLPTAMVDAVEVCPDALAVARQNIGRHRLGSRVRLRQADLFDGLNGRHYHLIVSNPPYVSEREFATLPREYTHEPARAFASGVDGLDLPLRILAGAARHLTADGVLIMEVGNTQQALAAALPTVPFLWLEFARGGHGVLLLDRASLEAANDAIQGLLRIRNDDV